VTYEVWTDYMTQIRQYLQEGEPYPNNMFLPPELYVYPGTPCSTSPDDPCSPGLVMAWSPTGSGPFSSAWIYRYPQDPDLSDSIITVTVHPPCSPTISVVSLGLKDASGNIRGWYWNVPATLPCGVATPISIDTSIAAAAAATPIADSFSNNPAFDITQVVEIIFDENCIWLGGTVPPPPGTTVPKAWNYWYDLTITPKPENPNPPLKWSQPPVERDQGRIYGWDDPSMRYNPPLLADDWHCQDQRPITDIHWWGSFLGWDKPEWPELPESFHIGIWTDVPASATANIFSHPDEMVWEYICTDYQIKFVGYDVDPRTANGTAPVVADSCFRFECDIP